MYLRVKEGKIVVTAPFWASDKQINGFIDKHTEWIQKKLLDKNIFLKDGDTITILGNPFQISFLSFYLLLNTHQYVYYFNLKAKKNYIVINTVLI